MDSVIMTTPGNSSRLRSRLRSAANAICARTSKHNRNNNKTNNATNNHKIKIINKNNSLHRTNSQHKQHPINNISNNKNCVNVNGNQEFINKNSNNNHHLISLKTTTKNENFAREVYSAWCGRLGPASPRIPGDAVQALFNDMQLYPSKAQVYEMLQCARQCGRRMTAGNHFLTFGEFCVFAGELRGRGGRQHHIHNNTRHCCATNNTNNGFATKYEVFLGGSCNPTTWRADVAIPTLTKLGITYYNPQVATWSPDMIEAEHGAKQSAPVLLFVLDSETRCVAGMVEVAQLTAEQRCLVLVVHPYSPGQRITNEIISNQEYLDLWHGQTTLLALVRRGVTPVFTSLQPAISCTAKLLREPTAVDYDCSGVLHLAEKLTKLREVFDAADINHTGELGLSDVCIAFHSLTGRTLSVSDLNAIVQSNDLVTIKDVRINFEQFCGIVAEFSNENNCAPEQQQQANGANTLSGILYWKLALFRTQQLLRIYVVLPFYNALEWNNQPLQRQCSTNNNSNCMSVDNHKTCSLQENDTVIEISNNDMRDIYLGGSCLFRTNWRQNIAIPMLSRYNLTYYEPALHEKNVSDLLPRSTMQNGSVSSDEDLDSDNSADESTDAILLENIKNSLNVEAEVENDIRLVDNSRVLLFVITNETRSVAPMLMAAHYVGLKRDVVLCIQQLPTENCFFGSEQLSKSAIKDYNRGRTYLSDLAKREGVPVFESVKEAVQCAVDKCSNRSR